MATCINKNSPEFKNLLEETGANPIGLAADVALWQKKHGEDKFPTADDVKKSTKGLEKQLIDGFLKDFNINHTEYENMKDDLGIDSYSASDLVTKSIAYQKGESILPEVAYFAYSMLGKKNNKIRGELKYLVNNWDKYKERFSYHADVVKQKEGFVADKQEWKNKIRDRVIIDFLKENLIDYYNNPQEFKKSLDTRWIPGVDKLNNYTTWERIVKWFEDTLARFAGKHKGKEDRLKNLGLAIADEILNKNYEYYNYELSEGQIQKYYNETINTDLFAKELVEFGQSIKMVLTGSLALRKAGEVYRTAVEAIHDIDWVLPFGLNSNENNTEPFNRITDLRGKAIADIQGKDREQRDEILGKVTEDITNEIKQFDWYKQFVDKYPGFEQTKSFFGVDQQDLGSITVQGVINPKKYDTFGYHEEAYTRYFKDPKTKQPIATTEMVKVKHNRGEIIKDTGYAIDFFVRLNEKQEEHENYFKLWKEIMIAKLKMAREKDFIDWKAFVPYVKSQNEFNFKYEGFRHINYEKSENNALEETENRKPAAIAAPREDIYNKERVSRHPQVSSPEITRKMKDFLSRIGVNVQSVNSIVVNGVKQNANGAAFMMQKLVQVVNGMEEQSLPEEAMHFAIEIIEQTDRGLFNELLKDIHNYEIYKDVMKQYGNHPLYQTKDGRPDIRKLKKEAMGQVLAETIVNLNEGRKETPARIEKAMSWWERIIQSIKKVFLKSGYDTLAMKILAGEHIGNAEDIKGEEESIYLQQSAEQDRIYNQIKDVHNRITPPPEGGDKYSINGREISKRVSNLIKTWFDELSADKALTNSEYQNALNELKAEKGTDGHKDLEYIFSLFIDEDGRIRKIPLDDREYQSRLNENDRDLYDTLKENFQQRLATYPEGTRFMSEVTVYDPNRAGGDVAGTIDFLAIKPNGHVDILDWKFKSLYTETHEDIPWYNINSWNRQMEQYKLIIQKVYGVKAENFDQTMMIPIRVHYTGGNAKEDVLPELTEVEIGDVNVKNIDKDYLIPVGLESQKTSDPRLDKLIGKLRDLYTKLSEKRVLPSEKTSKNEQMNALFKAIRHLHMKENLRPLVDQAQTLNKQVEFLIDKYENTFQGKDKSDFTTKQINDFAKDLELMEDVLENYKTLNTDLSFMFTGELSKEDKKLRKDLKKAANKAREFQENLGKIYTNYTVDFIGGTTNAEKIVRGITRIFGTTATIQLKGLQDLYKKAGVALGFASMDTQTEFKRLTDLKDKYTTWAYAKGLTNKNMFDIIKKKGSNELIDEFDREFYTEINKRIQNKDFAWIHDNIDTEAYKAHLAEKLRDEVERIESKHFSGNPDLVKYKRKQEIDKARERYSTSTASSYGWLLRGELYKFPDPHKWTSEEWKELNKKENEPALDFYNYIRERNTAYADIGYIGEQSARTFLPWVRKSFTETLAFGGNVPFGEQFLRNISVDESTVGYGKIDPQTGFPVDSIPKYFTKDTGEEYSTDLFKTMFLYNEMAIKFQYMTDMEYQARSLLRLEKHKDAIATSIYGRTSLDINGNPVTTPNNSENAKLVQDMVKSIVYGQKYIESETFDILLGKVSNVTNKINKTLGFELFPKTIGDREISVNRSIDAINNMFQLKALGLNPLSSFSNLFGGKTHSWINSGKYFTKSDYVSTEMWLLANKMGGEDKQKMLAALDYFMPFLDNYNKEASTKLSLKNRVLDENAIQDFLMVLMRSGEKSVQTTNAFAFMRHAIVMNGEVLNTREYLRSTSEYADFYSGTATERANRATKFEEDVAKLNETHGLLKLSTVDNNGNLVIPGVTQKSENVIQFRRTIQQFSNDALGSMSEENKRLINMTVYGNSFMVFKNWIPRLIDVRFGGIKYNAASDAYEWGRSRMVFNVIGEDLMKSLGRLKNSLFANDKGIEYMKEMFDKKREEYFNETGKQLDMTETEFINLVRNNIKNQLYDVLIYASLAALTMLLKAMAPDDDESLAVRNRFKFIAKATDKLKDELEYFYDITSITELVGNGIFPSIGLITDYIKTLSRTMKEIYGLVWEDDKFVDDNKVIKYWMRTFPFLNQAASLMPLFAPDTAKDLGIEMKGEYGIK
jgi:hypothetical protein